MQYRLLYIIMRIICAYAHLLKISPKTGALFITFRITYYCVWEMPTRILTRIPAQIPTRILTPIPFSCIEDFKRKSHYLSWKSNRRQRHLFMKRLPINFKRSGQPGRGSKFPFKRRGKFSLVPLKREHVNPEI